MSSSQHVERLIYMDPSQPDIWKNTSGACWGKSERLLLVFIRTRQASGTTCEPSSSGQQQLADCPAMSFVLVCWQIEISIWISWVEPSSGQQQLADCPAMSFVLVCWQIEIPIWTNWVGRSTKQQLTIPILIFYHLASLPLKLFTRLDNQEH